MATNTHYTITYRNETPHIGSHHHGASDNEVDTLNLELVASGRTVHPGLTAAHDVDLLTIYFTKDGDDYPSPPETFTLILENDGGHEIEPIFAPAGATASVTAVESESQWTLTITGPTGDEISDFQLLTPGPTPPHKLKIRVKRQPSFTVTTGPFDDVWGGEIS